MFTGIVAGTGRLLAKRGAGGGLAFDLEAGFDLTDPAEGESIAVNGVCLTAYNIQGRTFTVDVSPESLSRTTLGKLSVGGKVNMERALQLTDRLGGHIVSGHVDCVASVRERQSKGDYTLFSFSFPAALSCYVAEKGSVTIDGVSLTVNSCGDETFAVSIIPHTLQVTTLGLLKRGAQVNVEVDIIGKYVERLLLRKGSDDKVDIKEKGINSAFLAENGFF
ncbi:MAG: riboflavin synthase [Proteobacteria bacterium]|nr:riboflavin synthase [Pseudomonadota bacterium]MBU1137759.1 riboflavin synthase [Pseudomonadota bacterium]MBU1234966.1 riboflavin synthase [Pseudomonadota bacterium]MBU1417587.1 riboflavin synthase [Pseudomonadota bacterium]MBU1454738.1 riboflavin synthase [Pseudomonadota bacterium]